MTMSYFSHDHATRDATTEEIAAADPAPERDPEVEAAVATTAGPTPVAAGTFAVYPDGEGGFALVLGLAGEPEPHVQRIPAAMIKMVERLPFGGFGSLAGLLGR